MHMHEMMQIDTTVLEIGGGGDFKAPLGLLAVSNSPDRTLTIN